jgi:hypothetical protein
MLDKVSYALTFYIEFLTPRKRPKLRYFRRVLFVSLKLDVCMCSTFPFLFCFMVTFTYRERVHIRVQYSAVQSSLLYLDIFLNGNAPLDAAVHRGVISIVIFVRTMKRSFFITIIIAILLVWWFLSSSST